MKITNDKNIKFKSVVAAAILASASAFAIYIGGLNPDTGFPDPIVVDGETIEFTWTDDNTDEDLLIFTDKVFYTENIASADVYIAVANTSGTTQDVSFSGYFRDSGKTIESLSILSQVTENIEETVFVEDCRMSEATATSTSVEECGSFPNGTVTNQVTRNVWLEIEQDQKDIAKEVRNLAKKSVVRKPVDSFISDKSAEYEMETGEVVYLKAHIVYPAGSDDNFFFEAIGSEGAYGHLDPWFSSDWTYRKDIDITGQTGAGTNYQVRLEIGDTTGGDFHLEGNSANFPAGEDDGGDLRFVSSDGLTDLDFWVQEVSGGVATVWVEVSDDLGTDQSIFVYYGNAAATNGSDGNATFILYDDFEDGVIDAAKWNTTGAIAETGGQLLIGDNVANHDYVDSDTVYGVNHAVVWDGLITRETWTTPVFGFAGIGFFTRWQDPDGLYTYIAGNTGAMIYTPTPIASLFEVQRNSDGTINTLRNDVAQTTAVGVNSTDLAVRFFSSRNGGFTRMYVNWMILRKFNDTEPAFASAGAETTDTPAAVPEEQLYINNGTFRVDNARIIVN